MIDYKNLRDLLKKAERTPWEKSSGSGIDFCSYVITPTDSAVVPVIAHVVRDSCDETNAQLIVDAVNNLPELLDKLELCKKALLHVRLLAKTAVTAKSILAVIDETLMQIGDNYREH